MKQLKYILKESLLDDADDIFNDSVKESIIKFLKDNYHIKDYNISDEPDKDGKYIVDCEFVYVKNTKIKTLTNNVFKFGVVGGYFSCSHCESLKTLEGAPEKVRRNFNCFGCKSLTSLEGAPKEVGGDFSCSHCESLKTLEGAPKKVVGYFSCSYCDSLKSLEGAPEKVGGDFYCNNCSSLKSLEGAPEKVGGDFNCSSCNSLKTLKGAPKVVGKGFYCIQYSKKFNIEDVKKYSNIKGKIRV